VRDGPAALRFAFGQQPDEEIKINYLGEDIYFEI
jgi:hypothetical protein